MQVFVQSFQSIGNRINIEYFRLRLQPVNKLFHLLEIVGSTHTRLACFKGIVDKAGTGEVLADVVGIGTKANAWIKILNQIFVNDIF